MKSRLQSLPIGDLIHCRPFYAKVRRMHSDSRQVKPGDLFLAYSGAHRDGRHYITEAIDQGASAVFYEKDALFHWNPQWPTEHLAISQLAQKAGIIAAQWLNHPGQAMRVIGVTGTNGKTSITHWLAQAYNVLKIKAALMGTVGNGFLGELSFATHTTPDAMTTQTLLADFHRQLATVVAMETSSHGLDQGRVNGVPFETAIFTNLTRDHLDYHQTMAAYGDAKKQLFYWEGLRYAIINVDDAWGGELAQQLSREPVTLFTYGLQKGDIRLNSYHASKAGARLDIHTPWGDTLLVSNLIGRFNANNLLACLATLCVGGAALSDAARALETVDPVCGRMQRLGGKAQPLVVVDYAHTPDALKTTLQALSALCTDSSKLYCVFGCGGDRDRGKRPMMGAVAEQCADVPVVTSDNPRTEKATQIVQDIVSGMQQSAHIEIDRAHAIQWAIHHAHTNDIILIAGKGHETYQEIEGEKRPFSDIEVAQKALASWKENL